MSGQAEAHFDPQAVAIRYYFGELGYHELSRIAADALEQGLDGPSLRHLAGLRNPVQADMRQEEIDSAFREMGVHAPISFAETQLVLAEQTARRALAGHMYPSDAATHIRIYICGLQEAPPKLRRIVSISKTSKSVSRSEWAGLEQELIQALSEFVFLRQVAAQAQSSSLGG